MFPTSVGTEMVENKFAGPLSAIMRLVTQGEIDLSTFIDLVVESDGGVNISSILQILIDNHTELTEDV